MGVTYEFQSYTGGHYDRNTRYQIGLRFLDSAMNTMVGILDKETTGPATFLLSQNYPNPFNPQTRIKYEPPRAGKVILKVYNIVGNEICNLVDEVKPAGSFEVVWDGRDNTGYLVASGVYLYRIEAQGFVQTRKMLLLQ